VHGGFKHGPLEVFVALEAAGLEESIITVDGNDLTGLDHFAEGLAVGILTDEPGVDYVPRITR
jgi:hypothetical protein